MLVDNRSLVIRCSLQVVGDKAEFPASPQPATIHPPEAVSRSLLPSTVPLPSPSTTNNQPTTNLPL